MSNIAVFSPSKTHENKLIKTRIEFPGGVCIHNGIVHKNKDEWTVDDCTECTCQVRSPECAPITLCLLCLKCLNTRVSGRTLMLRLVCETYLTPLN